MRFDETLEAAHQLLQRRQRVSRRALQREFELDDAGLDDLVHELVAVLGYARIDEHGVLNACPDVAAAAPPAAEQQRRLITVMFCDIAGSTRLAGQLDPEDWSEVLHLYQQEAAAVLQPLGGHIAQYLGDGLLVYFGWPQAHEDDATRAVRAGLALQPELSRTVGRRLTDLQADDLQVRVGIHTGVVVVGHVGAGSRRELLALGEAPNLAAHIQSRAAPGTVVISDTTQRLLHDGFVVEDLGLHRLKDAAQPMRLAWVQAERDPAERRPPTRAPLIDVDGRLALLHQAWAGARDGSGRVISLRAEAGLGKSRLANELRTSAQSGGADAVVLRCSAFHRHSALFPIAEHLARHSGLTPHSADDEVSERLGELLKRAGITRDDALPLMAALLVPGSAAARELGAMSPAQLMQRTQDLLVEWLTAAARHAPLLLVVEDLHWADPSTLNLLQRLVAAVPDHRGLLLLLTHRPDFEPPWPTDGTALIELQRLSRDAIRMLVRGLAHEWSRPQRLPEALLERIVETADGVPLYAEEILRAVIDAPDGRHEAWPTQVPATLAASLMSRLDRLGPAKPIAQMAALLGREFSFELLAAVTERPAPELGQRLHQLTSAGVLQRHGVAPQARYVFRHALLQSAAEESLLRGARKSLHQRIAGVLESQFPDVLELEPETVARHFTEGGEPLRALPLWRRAGERALARSAVIEALADLDQGMALLPEMAAGEARDRMELGLQVLRLAAVRTSQGIASAAAGETSERVVALARALRDDGALITALNGLYAYHMVRGQCAAALAPAQQLLQVARNKADPTVEMIAHRALGAVAFHVGDPTTARLHLERSVAMYDHRLHAGLAHVQGTDHRVMAGNFLALTLFVLGEGDAAWSLQQELIAHAEAIGHAHSQAQALVFGSLLLSLRGDGTRLTELAERTVRVGLDHGFVLMAAGGRFFQGAAVLLQGDPARALPIMREGADTWWRTGARNYRAHVDLMMAQAEAELGHIDEVRALLRSADDGIALTGEVWMEPELRRVESLLLREADDEDLFRQRLDEALRLAENQGAHEWRRRCLATLAAQPSGPRPASQALLAGVGSATPSTSTP